MNNDSFTEFSQYPNFRTSCDSDLRKSRSCKSNNVRDDSINIGSFSDPFPVIESVNENAVVSTPVLHGQTAGALIMDKTEPFGKSSIVDFLPSIHENFL